MMILHLWSHAGVCTQALEPRGEHEQSQVPISNDDEVFDIQRVQVHDLQGSDRAAMCLEGTRHTSGVTLGHSGSHNSKE